MSATFLRVEHSGRIVALPFSGDYNVLIETIRNTFEIGPLFSISISADNVEIPAISAGLLANFTGLVNINLKENRIKKQWPGGANYSIPESILQAFPEVVNPRLPSLLLSTAKCNSFLTAIFDDLLNYCDPAAPYLDKIGACYQDVSLAICRLPGLKCSEESYWRKKLITKFHHAREAIAKTSDVAPLLQQMRDRFNPSKRTAGTTSTATEASSSTSGTQKPAVPMPEDSDGSASESGSSVQSEKSSFVYARSLNLAKHVETDISSVIMSELNGEDTANANVDPVLHHLQNFEHRVAAMQESAISSVIASYPLLQEARYVWKEACLMSSLYSKVKASDYVSTAELDISSLEESLIKLSKKLPNVVKSFNEAKKFLPTIDPADNQAVVGLKLLSIFLKVKPSVLFDPSQLVFIDISKYAVSVASEEQLVFQTDSAIDCIATFAAVFVAFNLQHLKCNEPVLECLEYIIGLRKRASCSAFKAKIAQLKALLS